MIILFSFFTHHTSLIHAQVPTVQDCAGAIPICQEAYIEYNSYSGSGHYQNEIYNRTGDCTQDCPGSCLDGEINSVWYVITVQNDGFLRFTIDPAGDDDYDWALYDLTFHTCSDIYTNYNLVQKSCNAYGYYPNGPTGISTEEGGTTDCNHCGGNGTYPWNSDLYVTQGSTYVLVVEDWTSSNNGFTINFGASTASIFDESPPEPDTVFTTGMGCYATEITIGFSERVVCESVDPADFQLTGPGGPFNILDAQGEACMIGGEMEMRYDLLLDRPIVSNGYYFLSLVPGNDVYDGCGNMALADTLAFSLDLGAPVLIDTGIVITPATEGMNNGHITGLIVNGTEPLSYRWYDHYNDTLATTLDLHDVYAGNYFLEITDTNSCETKAGPYFVDLVEDISEARNNHSGIISVFPNPNNGIFTIQVSKDVAWISIINMMGNVIYTADNEMLISGFIQLDLHQNGPGIYLIKAVSNNGMVISRLVQSLIVGR